MSLLRPGLHVVRRDDRHLQVGVDPPWRVVLPDEPEVHRLLADLAAGRAPAPTTPAAHRALLALARADLLVDPHRRTQAARTRAQASVSVSGATRLVAAAGRLLRTAGCAVTTAGPGTVALVLAPGEVRRQEVDPHVRDGRPHLVLRAGASGYTIGPFVDPGRTACLRCVDAHHGERDPRRAVVVEQVGGLEVWHDDPALEALVIAWAVRDVLAYADGGRPSTWSATVSVGPDLEPLRAAWARHPHCGCSWAQGLAGREVG
jgi:hypothetical protein